MKEKMTTATPDMPDSEAESLVVHADGDATLDDFTSETDFETDVEIETIDGSDSSSSFPKPEPRAKTRLLSRSHSANDLSDQADSDGSKTEPPRRNSSGDYAPPPYDGTPSPKPSPNILLQDLDLSRCRGSQHQHHRSSLTPTSGVLQPSPVSVHYSPVSPWKSSPHREVKEDHFTSLLQTTAERVLTRLKSRQQDLGGHVTRQKSQRRHAPGGLQPAVPRKLQPITRDGSRTPRSDCDLRSLNGDGEFGPLSAA